MSDATVGLIRMIGWAGLPPPVPEYRFHVTRRWRLDLAWPDLRVAVEVEGGIWVAGRHSRGPGFEADCEKYAEAAIEGWMVLRVTPGMIDDGRALAVIERGFRLATVWARTDRRTGCWIWEGATISGGYGVARILGRNEYVHRAVYEAAFGAIPDGLSIDHLCHNADPTCDGGKTCLHRHCVRPDHLEAVRQGVNVARGIQQRKARRALK